MAIVHRVRQAYLVALARLDQPAKSGQQAAEIRWLIEELRVSLFAQVLGTPVPVSEKRVLTAIANLADR